MNVEDIWNNPNAISMIYNKDTIIFTKNLCTFCNQELENIPHLFWQCGTSAQFWKKVQDKSKIAHY